MVSVEECNTGVDKGDAHNTISIVLPSCAVSIITIIITFSFNI